MQEFFHAIPLSYYFISSIINCITSFSLAAVLLIKTPHIRVNRLIAVWACMVGVWSLLYAVWLTCRTPETASFMLRTDMIPIWLVSAAFLHFSMVLSDRENKLVIIGNYIFVIVLSCFEYTDWFASDPQPFFAFPYWLKAGPLFHVLLIHFIGTFTVGYFLILGKIKQSSGKTRNLLQYILVGIFISYLTGSINYFAWYRVPFPPIFDIFVSVYVFVIGYGIIKHRFMNITLWIRRKALAAGTALVCANAYLVFLILGQRFLENYIDTNLLIVRIVIGIFVVWSVFFFYKIFQHVAVSFFMAEEESERNEFDRLLEFIVEEGPSTSCMAFIIDELGAIMNTRYVFIAVQHEQRVLYFPHVSTGYEDLVERILLDDQDALVTYCLTEQRMIVKNWLDEDAADVRAMMERFELEVCIPIFAEETMVGMVGVGKKRRKTYSIDELEVLDEFCTRFTPFMTNIARYGLQRPKILTRDDWRIV